MSALPTYVPKIFGKNLSLWDKLILFVFALILFDSTRGFDTDLNSYFVVRVMTINLRPQEVLIILAVFYVFTKPTSISILLSTTVGNLMIFFLLVVGIWTCIRVCQGEVTNMLLRMYLAWITLPIALCITLRKWESVVASFYMVIAAGLVGALVMGATAIFGISFMHRLCPGIVQRAPEAYNAHVGFFGQSCAWIRLLTFYVTANALLAKEKKQRFKWIMLLVYLFSLDVITMGRGRFVYSIFYLLFGLTFIAPVLGIYFRTKVKTFFTMSTIALVIGIFGFLSGTFTEFGSAIKTRYSTGATEIATKSGSFSAHYLAVFERVEMLKEEGIDTLLFGVGPIKDTDTLIYYSGGEEVTSININELNAVTGDSYHATLVGWYGLFGLFLMTLIGITCFRKYLRTPNLDNRLKYVGTMGSVAFILSGMFVASSANSLEANTLIAVWAVLIEYYSIARISVPNETNLIHVRQNPAVAIAKT
jgi:hypothetical protein